MAEPRYSDERQQFLERLARGRCAAVQRKESHGFTVMWKPTVDDEIVKDPSIPADGFRLRAAAVFAAKKFREQCRQQLAETNGSM